MNGIQIIQSQQNKGVIQMRWSGNVSLHTLRISLSELSRILNKQVSVVNLVIIVDTSTQLTKDIILCNFSQTHPLNNVLGWMIIGDNATANHIIQQLMHYITTPSNSQTNNSTAM